MKGISDYPSYILSVEVIFILRNVSLIAYVSEVTGLKMDMLFPVTGSVCPEITTSRIIKRSFYRMTHLKNHILESIDDEDSQEESYEDYILRKPNWILEKNDL